MSASPHESPRLRPLPIHLIPIYSAVHFPSPHVQIRALRIQAGDPFARRAGPIVAYACANHDTDTLPPLPLNTILILAGTLHGIHAITSKLAPCPPAGGMGSEDAGLEAFESEGWGGRVGLTATGGSQWVVLVWGRPRPGPSGGGRGSGQRGRGELGLDRLRGARMGRGVGVEGREGVGGLVRWGLRGGSGRIGDQVFVGRT